MSKRRFCCNNGRSGNRPHLKGWEGYRKYNSLTHTSTIRALQCTNFTILYLLSCSSSRPDRNLKIKCRPLSRSHTLFLSTLVALPIFLEPTINNRSHAPFPKSPHRSFPDNHGSCMLSSLHVCHKSVFRELRYRPLFLHGTGATLLAQIKTLPGAHAHTSQRTPATSRA